MASKKQQALDNLVALLKEQVPPYPVGAEQETYLLSWCREHGLGAFFYKIKDKYFSADFAAYINQAHKTNVQRNMIFLQEYQNLSQACQQAGLTQPVALKGLALLTRVHSIGERPLTDMDLYIPSTESERFFEIIKRQGFTPIREKKWLANQHKATFTKNVVGLDITLETHDKLFYNQPEDYSPTTMNYAGMKILSPDIKLVYLCAHLVHQHTFLKLFWLIDIHKLSCLNSKIWGAAAWDLARTLRVKTSLTAVAFCLRSLFGHNIPIPTKFLPMKYFLTWPSLILLNESRWKYLFMKHTSKDSLRESLAYDLRWLYFRMESTLLPKSKNNEMDL